jgi:hypothetical protein
MPRGAYAPRSWWFCGVDTCRRNCDLCDTRTLAFQERRASARRGTGSRTCNGDRSSWSDYVHHARSDGTPRLAYANRSRRRSWWTHANRRKCAAPVCTGDSFHNHGWLTPAAPGGRMRIVANVRWRLARAIRFTTTAGPRQPLLVPLLTGACESSQMCGGALHGRSVSQPRLAHASRSWCTTPVR